MAMTCSMVSNSPRKSRSVLDLDLRQPASIRFLRFSGFAGRHRLTRIQQAEGLRIILSRMTVFG